MMAEGKKTAKPDRKTEIHKQELSSHDLEARRLALEEKLHRKGTLKQPEQKTEPQEAASGYSQAIKLSSEFFAAIVVGAVLGIGFDQLAGTSPWGLIVFLFLGFAAGVLNVLRSAGRIAPAAVGKKSALRKEDEGLQKPDDE